MGKDNESQLITRPPKSFLSPLEQKAMAATGVLMSTMEVMDDVTKETFIKPVGSCTATAFKRRGNTYYFITAAHCVSVAGPIKGDMWHEEDKDHCFVRVMPWDWFIEIFDSNNTIPFMYRAELYCVGHYGRGDDFAVFKVVLPKPIPTIPLAIWDPRVGEPVINVSAPMQFGKQLFRGYVSAPASPSRHISADSVLLQLPTGPGASGSSIISQSQRGIIAILTSAFYAPVEDESFKIATAHIATSALPVSKFKKFWVLSDKGKYPYPAFVPSYFQSWMIGFDQESGSQDGCEDNNGSEYCPEEPPSESPDLPLADEIPE